MLQKLTTWPAETRKKKRFGRCKKAVILIRWKLGDFYPTSHSNISNASTYTRLASGTLHVMKEGAELTYCVSLQQAADMVCHWSRSGLRTHLTKQCTFCPYPFATLGSSALFVPLYYPEKKNYLEDIMAKLLKFVETFPFLFIEHFSVVCHPYLRVSSVDSNGVHNTN